jgi:molybdenum cofactor cytidylyltransferase
MGARVAALVLAAGRSSRFASGNKLLERVGGEAIVARVARAAIESGADPVVVVTGFDAPRVAEAVGDLDLIIAHNPAYAEGMSASLRAGLAALPADRDGALILLGDMPEIAASDLAALIAAFAGRDSICVPVLRGWGGNPILWGAAFFAEIEALTGDAGAKSLIARHADRVIEVPAGSPGIFADIDTQADLARLKATLK